jgi:hypothetical protein
MLARDGRGALRAAPTLAQLEEGAAVVAPRRRRASVLQAARQHGDARARDPQRRIDGRLLACAPARQRGIADRCPGGGRQSDAVSDHGADAHAAADIGEPAHANPNENAEIGIHRDPKPDPDADTDPDRYADRRAYAGPNAQAGPQAGSYADADTDAQTDPHADADPDPGGHADAPADSHPHANR